MRNWRIGAPEMSHRIGHVNKVIHNEAKMAKRYGEAIRLYVDLVLAGGGDGRVMPANVLCLVDQTRDLGVEE